jgi:hypothetical protein
MSKLLRIDFYKVTGAANFGEALKKIWALPNEDARTFVFSDSPARLRHLKIMDGLICGDMVRIRLGEPAFLAKLHGGERPITQDEDEGLGETNAFVYCPAKKHIAFQRNRSGVSASKMAYYVEQKNNLQDAIIFEPVIADVAVNELLGKAQPKRLKMKIVAGGLNRGSTQNATFSDLIEAANQMDSAEMEITFGMGRRRKGGMSKQGVIGFVKAALRLRDQGHDVKALEVSAPDQGSSKSELYDFIDATLKSDQYVEPSPLIDEFYKRRLACVCAAWDANQNELH